MERLIPVRPPTHRILINADDLGVSPARDEGIFECFRAGAITAASLLVDGADATAAAAEAVALDLPLGLHLNLTEGACGIVTLQGSDGRLRGKAGLRAALAAGDIPAGDLAAEIRRQFDRFIALTGTLPSHVDGHHHIHVVPQVAAVLAPIMAWEYGVCCVRLPREAGLFAEKADAEFEAAFQQQVALDATRVAALFFREGIYSTDAFIGQSLMGNRLSVQAIRRHLSERPPGSVELMVHPGIAARAADAEAFCRAPARDHERLLLQSEAWHAALDGWTRTSFRDLPRPGRDARPTVLIYGKLTPATGNAETARRMVRAWRGMAHVRCRPLLSGTGADLAGAGLQLRETETVRLRELAAREGLDLAVGIHVLNAGQPLAAAFGSQDLAHSPLPYGLLASGTDANVDAAHPLRRPAVAEALSKADFLRCLSAALRDGFAGLPGPADTGVLPNGIDVTTVSTYSLRTALATAEGAMLIFLPAGLRRLKGIRPAIDALAPLLATRFPRHVLIVLGPVLEADYAAEVQACIAAHVSRFPALSGRLLLHPGLPHTDYLAALREAALVLNTSEHEGQSHALMEAMAAGIPVLARDIPANRALVQEGVSGRLFGDFAALPAAYAECFDAPAETARLADAAAQLMARYYPVSEERRALQETLSCCLARRQVRLGRLRLDLAPDTHPVSPENLALFSHLVLPEGFPRHVERAADIGCGCGVFGLAALMAAARHGTHCDEMLFSDPHPPSLAALSRTLIRHAVDLPLLGRAILSDADLLDALHSPLRPAQIICANLPQTPAPQGFRLDRWGGPDGADLLCRFLEALPAVLAPDGVVFLLHIGLSHPARVRAAIANSGLEAVVLAEQRRTARFAEYEALQTGLADTLRAEHAAGRAEMILDAEGFSFRVQLLRLVRKRQETPACALPPACPVRARML